MADERINEVVSLRFNPDWLKILRVFDYLDQEQTTAYLNDETDLSDWYYDGAEYFHQRLFGKSRFEGVK